MKMLGEVVRRGEHALEALRGGPGRWRAGAIARHRIFFPGAFVIGRDGFFDLRVLDYQKAPALHVAAVGGRNTGFEDLPDQRIGHRVRFQPPHRPGRMHDLENAGFVGARFGHPVPPPSNHGIEQRLSGSPQVSGSRVRRANWSSMADVKRLYASASIVSSDRIVFKIRGNAYRLLAAVDFVKGILWIKWLGTHRDYDRIDVKEVNLG
jgi:mRNA-degrading endonuclease HigB of HigAB toxin-antitoxin module